VHNTVYLCLVLEQSSVLLHVRQTVASLEAIAKREGWVGLPMYAMGASSGGAFVLVLAMRLKLSASIRTLPCLAAFSCDMRPQLSVPFSCQQLAQVPSILTMTNAEHCLPSITRKGIPVFAAQQGTKRPNLHAE
jgi:hypothetical protein